VISLDGIIISGLGQGAQFMALPWVRDAIHRLIGFDPYPGTLNVRLLDDATVRTWRRIQDGPALRLNPPPPERCGARLFRVVMAPAVDAAVIVPDVTDHPNDVLEVIASLHVRSLLGLRDDDRVTLRTCTPEPASGQRG
jgi:riboflavin kinase